MAAAGGARRSRQARGSPVSRFESAVEAVVDGDVATLASLLRDHPELVRDRSARVTHFDPPMHRATLLHYVAANGVEGYRQKTPGNAVAVAKLLLEGGAEADALADMYGGRCTTMSLLVSSSHPAEAGLQVPLVHLLLDFGTAIDGHGTGDWTSPLMTALAFGYGPAAAALAAWGARRQHRRGGRVGAARGCPPADRRGRQRGPASRARAGRAARARGGRPPAP
jgi:hypothetical protein